MKKKYNASAFTNGGVAQFWLERRTVTAEVAGSNPVAPAILSKCYHRKYNEIYFIITQ